MFAIVFVLIVYWIVMIYSSVDFMKLKHFVCMANIAYKWSQMQWILYYIQKQHFQPSQAKPNANVLTRNEKEKTLRQIINQYMERHPQLIHVHHNQHTRTHSQSIGILLQLSIFWIAVEWCALYVCSLASHIHFACICRCVFDIMNTNRYTFVYI